MQLHRTIKSLIQKQLNHDVVVLISRCLSNDYYCNRRQSLYESAFETICENREDIIPDTDEEFNKIHEEAFRISNREWTLAVEMSDMRDMYLPGDIYGGVEERSKHKAFATLLDDRFTRGYEKVYKKNNKIHTFWD